ncbi:hypothetical protein L5515_013090 [Caenorhabditis briggsae]|uniref:Uncharacterized protein n=1 Tax=Caenorhabditis briggsae TaxID=6238 RepID=A0AAE9J5T5_CAEBR|nr:hypothetical protein L5515_013090 [Caenorhabditis briggsae]
MSGRGEEGAAKGGTTPPRSYLDHRHRGRGRPRKYPLAGLPRMPPSSSSGAEDVVMDSEEFRQEGEEEGRVEDVDDSEVYFPDDVVDEEVVVAAEDTVEDTVEEEDQDTVDPAQMEKIKRIQHQKMQLVTPMAQKRLRGRPPVPRGDTDDFQDDDDDEEMLMLDDKDPQNPGDVNVEEGPDGPPPAPPHLVNKQNSRGRPANPIPPHRRPLPKDLVPPGVLKRGATGERGGAKRRALLDEAPPLLHPPRGGPMPSAVPEDVPKEDTIIKTEEGVLPAPEAVEEVTVPPSEDVAAQKKGGLDLPAEHFPKNAAGHVATRGIHPIAAEKLTTMFEILEEEDVGEVIVGRGDDSEAQQRVLTLQGGSFIEDRIGRADLMEDEETRMMQKTSAGATSSEGATASYITVQEEDGRNVVYHVADGENAEEYVLEEGPQMKEELMDEEDDDDLPPELIPEGVADDVGDVEMGGDKDQHDGGAMGFEFSMMDDEPITLHSPNGGPHAVRIVRDEQGNQVFVDENGLIVELITDTGAYVDPSTIDPQVQLQLQMGGEESKMMKAGDGEVKGEQENVPSSSSDRAANVEFINSCSFLDTNQVCCGLCGEIVDYDKLLTEHLPHAHPEYQSQEMQLEEIPYTSWLKDRLKRESKFLENGFRNYDDPHQHQIGSSAGFGGAPRLYTRNLRQMRKVSQIRVNVNEMSMSQLETALKRKLIEKMGRKVPVSLVDRLHARCDICQAVVSLNKKFEVIHLVRHFNAWHPAEHRCSQEWKEVAALPNPGARHPLSLHDFAVVSTETDQNNLQCIWCGMFMDRAALGMHFSEIHTQQIIVPNCSLCLQEMVMTARFMEKYGKDFGISLPDEFHLQSSKLGAKYSSEKAMDKAIEKHLKRIAMKGGADQSDGGGGGIDDDDDDQTISITNSQQSFGRRNRLKRKFVKPCFRQVCPPNSEFFEPKSACEWRCRLCNRFVYAAVISAGAIKHFKEFHPAEIDKMQYELVKARLERIGDGSMEFVHPQLVECLICNLTYALHKPFNICRAIRHLRLKHPEVMPETSGKSISGAEIAETVNLKAPVMTNPSTASTAAAAKKRPSIRFGDCITDPIELEKFRKENWDQQFDKVQVVYGIKKNDEPAFILLMDNEQMDEKTAMEMAEKEQENGEEVREETQRNRFDELVGEQEGVEEAGQEDVDQKTSIVVQQEGDIVEEVEEDLYNRVKEEVIEEEEEYNPQEEEGHHVVEETEFMPTYDANNPDHVLIEENDEILAENYEMIQDGEYQEIEEDSRTVRYLTEEEIREAQARGEILEFEEEVFEEEVDEYQQ